MNTPPRFFAAPPPLFAGDDKAALRVHMRRVRRQLKMDDPQAAQAAARAILAADADIGWPASPVVAVYNAQGSELDAWPLAQALVGAGATIALPVALSPDAPLVFRQVLDGDLFAGDAAGVPAPSPAAPLVRPHLIFAPLLAFDRFGGRLGQGGGYYDRTLAALRAQGPAVTVIGLAYAGQEVDRAPLNAHDARLDGVLTQAGLTLFPTDG